MQLTTRENKKGEIVMKEYNLNEVTVNIRVIVDEGNDSVSRVIEVIDDYNDAEIIARNEMSLSTLMEWAKRIKTEKQILGDEYPVELRLSNSVASVWCERYNNTIYLGTSNNRPGTTELGFCNDNIFVSMTMKDLYDILTDGLIDSLSAIY